MKATLLLSTLVIGLIGVTPSSAQSVSSYSRNFGYPSYALRTRRRCSARRTMGINEAAQRATRKLGAGVVASDVQSEGSSRRRLTPVGARHSSRLCRSPAAVLVAETAPLMARMARFVLGERNLRAGSADVGVPRTGSCAGIPDPRNGRHRSVDVASGIRTLRAG
jgi:hypothetical protein